MKNFNPQDLSVREVEYSEQYKLNKKQYCELKTKIFIEACAEFAASNLKQAKIDVRHALRKEIIDELKPILLAEAEKKAMPAALQKAAEDLVPEMKKNAYARYREEWAAEKVSPNDREAFLAASREVEIDSLTFAMSASHEADEATKFSSVQMKIKKIGLVSMLLGAGPFLLGLALVSSPSAFPFWFLLAPYITLAIFLGSWEPEVANKVIELRKTASQYLQLVSRARMMRLLSVSTDTRDQIASEFGYILEAKNRLDEKYRPSLKLMEEVKPNVKLRLSDEMDPEKLFSDEFDDRLKAAEEGAKKVA